MFRQPTSGSFDGDLRSGNSAETANSGSGENEWEEEARRPRGTSFNSFRRRPQVPVRPIRPRTWLPVSYPYPYPWTPEKPDSSQEPSASGSPATTADYPGQGSEFMRWVQSSLNGILNLRLPVDGIMNVETRAAIRDFQHRENLFVDGILGPETRQALINARKQLSPIKGEYESLETEITGENWESEVDRHSPAYNRWVQQSLNRISGLTLAVDGIIGSQTRSAIRNFQQRSGLTPDGIVGTQTERALVNAGAGQPPQATAPTSPMGTHAVVNTQLPTSGSGFYSTVGPGRRYGQVQAIQALQAIGAAWQQAYPRGPRIGIADISFQGGGKMPPHKSHQVGLDVDIRLMRSDGREQGTQFQDAAYSRTLTQDLVYRIINNGILRVQYIFFNDPQVKSVRYWPGHHNHLHVRFYPPSPARAM